MAGAGGTCSLSSNSSRCCGRRSTTRVEPAWIGIPFFYWYQLLWVIIGAVLTAIVYFATED